MNDWMKNIRARGIVFAPDGRGSGVKQHQDSSEEVPVSERFDVLMSLALDDMLSSSEEAEFEKMLAGDSGLSDVWYEWQAFDYAFQTAPSVEPPVDFVASFENRMVRRERRRRMWLGISIGVVAVVLWGSLVLGLAGAGAYVMFNQSGWLTSAVRVVVQTTAALQSQLAMFADAMTTALATPQIQGMVFSYMVFAVAALWFWMRFLRRSVETDESAVPNIS